jgi:hypothetical protein
LAAVEINLKGKEDAQRTHRGCDGVGTFWVRE